MSNDMNQTDLVSGTAQHMVELQPLLSSHPVDLPSDDLQQQHAEDEATIKVKKRIENCGDGILLPDYCIYRVPITLRPLKEKAYTPQIVSIGPFRYGDSRLQGMERHKEKMFKRFTQRATSSLDNLARFVKHLETKIRACYSETINLSEQELVELTLMDAGFVIQLFIMYHEKLGVGEDAKLVQPWLNNSICEDLILLENQLPFFAIEGLFNKAFPHDRRSNLPSFLRHTYKFFGYLNKQELEPNPDVKIKHFTDLLRLFYLQGKMSSRRSLSEVELSYNANALQEAGIKFKASKSKCLLDLKISGNILEIPQILLEKNTELVFRNMIALEQCHYPYNSYITDYAIVLDCVIDTYKDVDLLVHNKILRIYGGDSNDVALLFNGVTQAVVQPTFNSEYLDIFQRLNGCCENPWHKMKATLRRDYCHTPWQTVASIAAIVLLFLTIVQTITSILQVVKK